MNECQICYAEYQPDDDITPLPCHESHYYHSECIASWIKQKPECPLCRAPLDLEELMTQERQTMLLL